MTSPIGDVASRAAQAGGTLVRHVRSAIDPSAAQPAGADHPASGWLVVSVLCEPSDIDTARLPVPLAQFGDRIEVRVQPGADSKGTELAARLRERVPSGSAPGRVSGSDPQAELRSALRRAKQLIEVGEVLAQQHGHRYVPEILDRMSRDEVRTEHLATHVMPLDDGPQGYRMFKNKEDGCVRAVFRPGA